MLAVRGYNLFCADALLATPAIPRARAVSAAPRRNRTTIPVKTMGHFMATIDDTYMRDSR